MIVITVNTAEKLINVMSGMHVFNAWDESKHPRDKDGKFGKGGKSGQKPSEKVSKIIASPKNKKLSGKELGEYTNMAELRSLAKSYYKKHYQGRVIERPELGKITFSRKGINETLSNGAQETKIKLIPAIEDVIMNGKIGKEMPLNHPRKDDIISFVPVISKVMLENKLYQVGVFLGKDRKGHLYYDMFVHQ